MSQDLRRFGHLVRDRRKRELRLSQERVAEIGGPSTTTMSKIENGQGSDLDEATLNKLDDALGWIKGSARRTLEGGFDRTSQDRRNINEP